MERGTRSLADTCARRAGLSAPPPSEAVYGRPRRIGWLVRSAAAGGAALLAAALMWRAAAQRRRSASARNGPGQAGDAAAECMHGAAAVLAFSVFADSALEHYRGKFHNKLMLVAPSVAGASMLRNLAALDGTHRSGAPSRWSTGTAFVTGLLGAAFHLHNVRSRPGGVRGSDGLRWTNLLYAAPLGAPFALTVSAVFASAAERCRRRQHLSGRSLLGFTALALLGTSLEVAQLHFRGAFQNPFMYLPVSIPLLTAVRLASEAAAPRRLPSSTMRPLLLATGALGVAGVGFHAYGLARNMGGFRNWSQNLFAAPPLPAPPAFTGIALGGLGALRLLEEEP